MEADKPTTEFATTQEHGSKTMETKPGDGRTSRVSSDTKGKGKDVARDDETQHEVEATKQADSGDSVMSRLGRSAAGLSRSILQGKPTSQDLANSMAPAKAAGSFPSSSANRNHDILAAQGSSSSSAALPRAAEFRSAHADEHVAAEEAAFSEFLDSTGVFVPTDPVGLERAWQAANPNVSTASTAYGGLEQTVSSSVAEQQESDGVEVVRLLSQAVGEEEQLYEDPVKLSQPELENLHRALFEGGSATQLSATDWNNLLNFIPDFLRHQDVNGVAGPASSHVHLGVSDHAEAGQLWLEDWNRVLTSYTDEVWGDLGDLVQEARREVEQIKERGSDRQNQDPAALWRLQTVLTRVRARL